MARAPVFLIAQLCPPGRPFPRRCSWRLADIPFALNAMRALITYPGNFSDARQAALAFHERGALAAFVTGVVLDESNFIRQVSRACGLAALDECLRREFGRRTVPEIPRGRIVCYPWLESLRTVLARYAKNPILADVAWDAMSHRFDRTVARRHLGEVDLVYAYEYTARATFQRARDRGIACILGTPSLDSMEFENIKNHEESKFPDLKTKYDTYFARRLTTRYARRRAEIGLADLVIANSELTRCSHIRAGTDPKKIVAVPLAAPPPIEAIEPRHCSYDNPLSVIWAGTVSLRKGAHYLFDSWRALRAGNKARVQLYGKVVLPERVLRPLPEGLELLGSVPQQRLWAAYDQADVLVFPTLSDGFGAVVLEAFSRGVPVITTPNAGASQFVKHGKNGIIVQPADAAALTEALSWCLDNRETVYQMRFAALETARRWQWRDHRRMLIDKVAERLNAAGYAFGLRPLGSGVSA
jgi:glycosyltransferase involved in cell wall biosynthesis